MDITPLYKEMNFDFEAQLKKLRNFLFPYTDGQNRRRFQLAWFNRFQWIEYSTSQDAAYCNTCRQFGSKSKSKDPTFITIGFRHESSETHLTVAQSKSEKQIRLKTNSEISTLVNSTVLSKRRYYMTSVIETIIFLVEHLLPLRGNGSAILTRNTAFLTVCSHTHSSVILNWLIVKNTCQLMQRITLQLSTKNVRARSPSKVNTV